MKILNNCWYAAAWSNEVKAGELFPLRIADLPMVFFRRQNGEVAAIADYCPHRFAPLHRGKQVGDIIQCGYHGLEFDAHGKCVRNPHEAGKLPNASVPAYQVAERYSVIWVWIGDQQAEPALISDEFAFLEDPRCAHVRGRFHVNANYLLLLDNLNDISHALYVHGDALMTEDLYASLDPQLVVEGDVVKVTVEPKGITAPGLFRQGLPEGTTKTDLYDYVKTVLPANVIHDIAYTQPGETPYQKNGVSSRSAHFFTPETNTTAHYLFDNSRDFLLGDEEADARVLAALTRAFGEQDIPMIEAQQKVIGERELFDLRPVILVTDRGAVMARRNLAKRIKSQEAAADDLGPNGAP
ncbi:Rieske 2Fe-2S domain-containing protein [Paraburkholderia sediminicola]|uniref:Rieske 2Fe-2S domain-containing protein n=1 Tax=Paraburkholderia sediminicola TaxID=458836 RepID=UPI0038BC3459